MEKNRLISLITVCFSSKKEVVSSVKKLLMMMMITIAINITKTVIKDQTSILKSKISLTLFWCSAFF